MSEPTAPRMTLLSHKVTCNMCEVSTDDYYDIGGKLYCAKCALSYAIPLGLTLSSTSGLADGHFHGAYYWLNKKRYVYDISEPLTKCGWILRRKIISLPARAQDTINLFEYTGTCICKVFKEEYKFWPKDYALCSRIGCPLTV